jgi:molybdopterin molybdotransferase
MISYKQSRQILKKSLIKIKDEYIRSDDSLNRVSSTNIISTTN